MRLIDEAQTAVFREDFVLLKQLIQRHHELIHARDDDGRTLLMMLALEENPNLEMLNFIIDHGAELEAKDNQQQWTVLHFAARDQNCSLVKLLLDRGAQVDPVDCFGNTPLWRAVMNYRGDKTTIEVLLRHGANPDKTNHHGSSPRKIASESFKPGLKELFIS